MLACMKRLAVSSRDVSLPVSRFRAFTFNEAEGSGLARFRQPCIRARQKGEEYSPAHEGIRRVGAPSTQRPCSSGQANIRAHPPVEPARDHEASLPHHRRVQTGVPQTGSAATGSGCDAEGRDVYTVPSRRSA
jgi:hypothetical protein